MFYDIKKTAWRIYILQVQADLEYERRLAVLREELRTEADKKTLKVQQLFKEKSLELASQAETRHQQEMESHHRQIREEEQRVIDQVKSKFCRYLFLGAKLIFA